MVPRSKSIRAGRADEGCTSSTVFNFGSSSATDSVGDVVLAGTGMFSTAVGAWSATVLVSGQLAGATTVDVLALHPESMARAKKQDLNEVEVGMR